MRERSSMENFYPVYEKVEDWSILDRMTVHDFNENEHTFEAINVQIGNLIYDDKHTSPITRWIPRKDYECLLEQSGMVVW